jgi:hypothetical protein
VKIEAPRGVLRSDHSRRIGGHYWRRWYVGQRAAIGSPKLKGPVGPTFDPIALLVHGAMMPATEERQIREFRRAPMGPVPHVMPLGDPDIAAREAAGLVSMLQRPPERRGDRPRSRADFHHPPIWVVPHHHPASVAGQAP